MERDLYESTMRTTRDVINGPIKNPGRLAEVFWLDRSIMVIGCDATADVHVEGPSIAEYHAEISHNDGTYTIRHLDGEEKVKVNGRVVDNAVLSDGDDISIGHRQFTFASGVGESNSTD